ncbi:ABC transporter substrate-binding protein [Stackebrandtia nassauensis]|uniref:Extracellular solute-binding protein family 5 n=1 Tax=Stackebrandtia nassauensis (strain DSM 44728 / CIP 108903 / NRRL B-16338 / NBRC 102104 / LLR-40K-21) TaxID=446470 RepID=D3Q2M1_STANL|nr:ABC transporter substrate-binding protein [Stackebrandtia nassauensis]ADD45772.1 extracellular solute-binding protein family 5 [Stackebrandtia nassauensis DSM 44728]
MRNTRSKPVRLLAVLTAAGVAAALSACAADPGAAKDNDKTAFKFATASEPTSLDPALASDGETFRVNRQVVETLVEHKTGGDELVPGLAKEYSPSKDGRTWNFTLNEGVKFHDGDDLTAEAVCANFDRWYNWKGVYQNPALSGYWQDIMGGFAKNENKDLPKSNYDGCKTDGEFKLSIKVKEPTAKLPGGFSLSSLGILSPKTLAAADKQQPKQEGESIKYPDYSQEVGTIAGTGPYEYSKWDKSQQEVTIKANKDYWGKTNAKIKTIIFKAISEENDRKSALISGDVDGYDLVAPQDIDDLKKKDMNVLTRDPFNIFYIGLNQKLVDLKTNKGKKTVFADKDVRKAIAHSINKDKIIKQIYPKGTEAATQFQPPSLDGWSDNVPKYEYDKDKAKALLKKAGQSDMKIDFCYPTKTTRPYMPDPKSIFDNMKSDLEAVGITVEEKPLQWSPTYGDQTSAGGCSMYILGWTADYAEAFNFNGTWFSQYTPAWGFKDDKVFDALAKANAEADPAERAKLHQKANEAIMDYVPGVPISHSSPSIAFADYVKAPTLSPLTQENFAETSFK